MKYIPKAYPNWRAGSESIPPLATFLGGFSLTLMALTLRTDIKTVDFNLFGRIVASHALSLILMAIAVLFFVYAIQCLLRARSSNYFDIKTELIRRIEDEAKELEGDIEQYARQMDLNCKTWYARGTHLFDLGLLCLLGGTAILVYPYEVFVTALFLSGIAVEILWLMLER